MAFDIKFRTIEELKTKLNGNNLCHTSEETREGMVKFCELHPEIEFVEASLEGSSLEGSSLEGSSLEGWSNYQWEYSAELTFKYTFYNETEQTLIEAHWYGSGVSDDYWFDFDINDVEYYPGSQYKNGNWHRV